MTSPNEGDVNASPLRASWRAKLGRETADLLDRDERYFIRQALSTPCLDVIERAEGAILIEGSPDDLFKIVR